MADVERPEMTLRDYWRVVIRRKWLIVAAMVATVVPAVALTALQDPLYESSGDVLIDTSSKTTIFGSGSGAYVDPDRAIQNQISLLQSNLVYERMRSNLGIDSFPPSAAGYASEFNDLVSVYVQSGDPATAAVLVDAYMEAFAQVAKERAVGSLDNAATELQLKITDLQTQIDRIDAAIAESDTDEDTARESDRRVLVDQQAGFKQTLSQLQVDAALETGGVQVVRLAFVPVDPIEPRPTRTAALALVVGLLLGLGAAFLRDYLDDSIEAPDDLAKLGRELPILSLVPVEAAPDHRPISMSQPDARSVEGYRTLRTNVQFLGIEREVKVVQITSSIAGEGKTTTASNLAVVLAQTGATVVLVDADLRKPQVHRVFATDASMGLTNNLVGEDLDMTITPVVGTLSVISSGRIPPNPSEMLSGRTMAHLVAQLKTRFDYVIVDSAPVLAVSDAVALSRHVDGVVLVVQAGRTSAPQVRSTLDALDQVGAPILGVVLNRADNKHLPDADSYAFGYGYGAPVEPARR